jgi:hypothetical protein
MREPAMMTMSRRMEQSLLHLTDWAWMVRMASAKKIMLCKRPLLRMRVERAKKKPERTVHAADVTLSRVVM